ncbi:MAG TPA: TIGR03619 family F420-dependent LLM class oxidoreductase [Candidatus Bathyarchaeia archaeon]|nr:TIGR03619 family F420-dependent LLM class oxidoreductase [Candidatus Bathyarchaeia archaeon]
MEFGIHLPQIGPSASPSGVIAFAQRAEQLGFDSVWVSDHIVFPSAVAQVFGGSLLDPITTLAFVAPMTRRVKLGTSVLIVPYRDPLVLAKMLSSLDVLSGGRVIAGVGSGWLEGEFEALALRFADRGKQTDEYLTILGKAWSDASPTVEHRGAYRTITDVVLAPRPQQSQVPIWIGGNSPVGIARAARFGQAWHPVRVTPNEVAAGKARLESAANAQGRKPGEIAISARVPLWFSDDPTGTTGKSPLIGTADELVAVLHRYGDAGAGHVVVDFFLGIHHEPAVAADPQHFIAAMERFAREVMPRVSQALPG